MIKQELYQMISDYDIADVVTLNNRTSDISFVFKNTHALVTASKIESFGMTLIEAMAHSRPIIVSRSSGHIEILKEEDGNYGFYCEVDNPESFADRMEWVIKNRDKAYEMGLRGYKVAQAVYSGIFSVSAMNKLLCSVVEDDRTSQPFTLYNRYILCDFISAMIGEEKNNYQEINPLCVTQEQNVVSIGNPQHPVVINNCMKYQIFVSTSSISQVSVVLGTHQRRVKGKIILSILASKNSNVLRTCKVDLEKVQDNSWVTFSFETLNNVKNRHLWFEFTVEADGLVSIYETTISQKRLYYRLIDKIVNKKIRENLCCQLQ